jgi:site-specific DNA recombinase
MARLPQEIARIQPAKGGHVDDQAALAARAAELFEQQPAIEKRKLLRFLVEECRWTSGHLTFRWKQPFERAQE